ncbi:MAG: glutathione S-transferase N-terminal domain-containing protein [Polyangiales bacterium]
MQIAGTSLKPLELWRPDVTLDQARNFASAIAAAAVRGGSGGRVTFAGPRPRETLVLYERENCPYSRLVRETLSELDLDALVKPCPAGEGPHNRELRDVSGKSEVPFLVDKNQRVSLGGTENIIRYLTTNYGSRSAPARLRSNPVSLFASRLASTLRGGDVRYGSPKRRPDVPLELFNYEASPYCRMVREQLDHFGIAYVSHNLARRSPKRSAFKQRFGREQFPYLYDPNTRVGMFESQVILRYLTDTYVSCFDAVPAEIGGHPA